MIRRPPTPTLFPYTTLFRSKSSISSAISRPGTPSRISGSCTYRWNSRTSASAIRATAWPYTRTSWRNATRGKPASRSEEHTSELQSRQYLVCRLLLVKKQQAAVDHVWLCGPLGLVQDARTVLEELGVPAEKVHFELFFVDEPLPTLRHSDLFVYSVHS